jgi:hypothetical protein
MNRKWLRFGSLGAAGLLLAVLAAGCKQQNASKGGDKGKGDDARAGDGKPGDARAGDGNPAGRDGIQRKVVDYIPVGKRTMEMQELQQLGGLYLIEAQNNPDGRGPASLEAWKDLRRDFNKGYEAIKEGDFVLYWGVRTFPAPAGASNTVLGYAKGVPENGGIVLYLSGTPGRVTAEEFKNLAKAGKP